MQAKTQRRHCLSLGPHQEEIPRPEVIFFMTKTYVRFRLQVMLMTSLRRLTSTPFFNTADAASTWPFPQRTWRIDSPCIHNIHLALPDKESHRPDMIIWHRLYPTDSGCRKASSSGEAPESASRATAKVSRSPAIARSYNYRTIVGKSTLIFVVSIFSQRFYSIVGLC